ncbi:MAG TPA: TAT-variant-translocated molybdopterin oxidoreductase [Bacteroidia bacterium]|nr:TAT-variant-translocated molybdopterin oxidoreductase [Bacteroidia bacterium]HRG52334.1 TAT-variant-translocated molybdopterin oxidoreductase [Bacteroidia bacterium]
MATKKYWKGLEELNNSPEFVQKAGQEFAEQIPVEEFLGDENLGTGGTNRRDFLKFLGFSVTAASLAACETPVNKAIPYLVKPEEITLGVANWYASTYYDGRDYSPILVKTREGRPIKVKGNNIYTTAGPNARVYASVLSLYDSARLSGPTANGKATSWIDVDKEIGNKLAAITAKGGAIRILSSTIISPSTKAVINEFTAKYPTTKHVTYDAISFAGIAKANAKSFGKEVIPSYSFDKAQVIVSIGADFLANWIEDYSVGYAKNRKVSRNKAEMSKHYQFESNLSLTGANADERVPVKVSEQGKVAVNLYNAVAKLVGGSTIPGSSLESDPIIAKAAKDLADHKGSSLVVSGSNDTDVQVIVNAINSLLDNYGKTIDINAPSYINQSNDQAFADLVAEMASGKVDALITYNTNPVYTAPAALKFADAYSKVGLRISFADRADETASLAQYICPDHHYLESWNDFNPKKSVYSLAQPTISPLFSQAGSGTRQAQETLLKWAGNTSDYHAYIQKVWNTSIFPIQSLESDFTSFWNKSLHDGIIEVDKGKEAVATTTPSEKSSVAAVAATPAKDEVKQTASANLSESAQKINAVKSEILELALYEKVGLGNGNQANNPWLQELPDPITRITWDNYITMSPIDMAKRKLNLMERQDRVASLASVTVNGTTIELPVVPQPGQAEGTIGIAVGYGREKAGKLSEQVNGVIGKNAFPFVSIVDGTQNYTSLKVEFKELGTTTEIAGTQIHHTLMGREIVKETNLENYRKDPRSGNHPEMLVTHSGKKVASTVDLWDEHEKLGHRWGMTIDLNSCFGCGACVVSCTSENNVAVVGKDQVMKTREMHWLRIDRYYSSDMSKEVAKEEGKGAIDMYLDMENPSAKNPKVVFQPMMCQHCNHAPCENVCPVLATNHSSDGLNQMTYNRCVGTRYCANNCPFKVRRFNWFNYNENKDFTFNPTQDDLGRMVMNPDVVVRSRGVMEKCSMCVQRVQAGKLEAKKAGRKLVDGDVIMACQEACPTHAIVFGDLNDPDSEISMLRREEEEARNYFVLDEIGVKPTVSYLTKVRNCEETIEEGKTHGEHSEGKHAEGEHAEKAEKTEAHS